MSLFLLYFASTPSNPSRTATGTPLVYATSPRRPSFWRSLLRALSAWGA